MALELLRNGDCIEYTGTQPRIPALKLTVQDPVTKEKGEVLAAVDTGFAGYLLLRKELYDRFATAELPAEFFTQYSTMAGPVILRKARATVEIGKLTLQAYIETPQHGPGRDLIGRRLLKSINIALLGKTEKCCLLQNASQSRAPYGST